MPPRYVRPASLDDALTTLGRPAARALGGGTDLLVSLEAGVERANELVDVRRLPGARDITELPDGGLRLGAAVRLADIAKHDVVRERFAVLAQAARAVGTPALRAMGTIAGNLCQRPRCWYLRHHVPCLKSGASGCLAEHGQNQYHAILGGGPCFAVHPSDGAVALTALEAVVVARSARDSRRIPMADLYAHAASDPARETTLTAGEMIEAVEVAAQSAGGTQRYTKLTQRGAFDFALVSLAAVKRPDGEVRLVLGGVAPRPWRVDHAVEEDVASGGLDNESIDALVERALYDAHPLQKNGYKVRQAGALLRRAMAELSRA